MNAPAIQLPHAPTAGRIGQATEIEKSRAAAEVYYRLAAAKELPRDEARATEQMRLACQNYELAKVAFYAVPKGNDQARGPSVHLARELARIWGNLDYGVVELRRDDEFGQSEMQAFALDLQTNTRPSSLWIQPHRIDTKKGPKVLVEVQAIYENNSNAGARRVREQIFAVLPKAFLDEAKTLCRATLERGNGDPIEKRRADAVAGFASTFKVTEAQLTERMRREPSRWDAQDLADLAVLYGSLQRGEVTVEVEFPVAPVSADAITAAAKAARAKPADPPVPADDDEAERLREQQEMEREIAEQDAADDDVRTES